MINSLLISVDDLITHRSNNNPHAEQTNAGGPRATGSGFDHGSSAAHGRTRRFVNRRSMRASPYSMRTAIQEREMVMMKTGGRDNAESEAKLYISNLDYGVSTKDIKLLFSDVGELRSQSVHYDKSGRTKGTAEVVFARQIDALAAIEKYNNLPLDGKPMTIELIGADSSTATSSSEKPRDVFKRLSHVNDKESFVAKGRQPISVHGRESTKACRHGKRHGAKPTAQELDADMDRYHFEAKP